MTLTEKLQYISKILSEERYTEIEKLSAIKGFFFPAYTKGRIEKYSLSEITQQIEDHTGITLEKITNLKRADFDVITARQMAHYKAIKFTKLPLALIGYHFGEKDHATVLHSHKTILNYLEVDKHFRKEHEVFLNT